MARGITQDRVNQAADALLQRGERPTIDKVRAELGTGSPNTLIRMLEVWWTGLAERLAAQARADLPGVPEPVQRAMMTVWSAAIIASREEASTGIAVAKDELEQEKQSLAAERLRWSVDLESARTETQTAKDAHAAAELRLADHQRLVEHLHTELRDVKAQRDKLQEQADILVQDMIRLGAKLEKQEKDHAAERTSTAAHIRTIEDRAHAEVDRVRTEIKALRSLYTQAEHASQQARDSTSRERKEHLAQLRTAERDAVAQRARAEALEGQLQRLGNVSSSTALAPRRASARPRAQRKQKTAAKERLLDKMMMSTARASAAIDETVAYVESSNRKLARVRSKKKKPG